MLTTAVSVLFCFFCVPPSFYVTIDSQRHLLPCEMYPYQWLGISIPPPQTLLVSGWVDTNKVFEIQRGTNFYLYQPTVPQQIKIFLEETYVDSVIVIPEMSSLSILLSLISLKGFNNGVLHFRKRN